MFSISVCCYYSLVHAGNLSSLILSTGTLHPHCALEEELDGWKYLEPRNSWASAQVENKREQN